jgi:P27 family predicted phage terminase small subunit
MPGRKRKPTAMVKAAGTYRKDRHENRLDVQEDVQGRPDLPTYQSSEETFHWLVKHLDDLGVVAELDAIALQMLSDAWEDYCAARQVIKTLGPTYTTTTAQGDEMHRPRPELGMMNGAWDRIKKMLPEFGLTAAARAKLSAPERLDSLEDLLNG